MGKQSTITKTTHSLKSPNPEPEWPTISIQIENQILDALLPLLAPIGEYRERCKPPSKGKGRKRPKRTHVGSTEVDNSVVQPAPAPDIQKHLTIGFNSTVRRLESFIAHTLPTRENEPSKSLSTPQLFVIFVCLSNLPSVLTAPLPLLAAAASSSTLSDTDVRLVPISQGNVSRIAESLRQPQANFVGVAAEAHGIEELHKLVRINVQQIKIPWIQSPAPARYEPLKVHSEDITIGKTSRNNNAKRKAEKIS